MKRKLEELKHQGSFNGLAEREPHGENLSNRQGEDAHSDKERKYRALLDNTLVGVFETDIEGRIIYVNEGLSDIFGYTAEDIKKANVAALYKNRNDRDRFVERLRRKGRVKNFEVKFLDRGGAEIDIIMNAVLEGDSIIGTLTDITERKRAEDKLVLTNRILEVLSGPNDMSQIVKEVLSLIREYCGIEAVGIRLRRGDSHPFYECIGYPSRFIENDNFPRLSECSGEAEINTGVDPCLEYMIGLLTAGRTDPLKTFFTRGGSFRTNSISGLKDNIGDREFIVHARGEGYESTALIPVRSEDEVLGILQMNDKRVNVLTPQTVEFLEKIGSATGIAIRRMQLNEDIKRNEEKYFDLVENIQDGVYQTTPQGRFLMANRKFSEMLGYESVDDLTRGITDIRGQLYARPEDRDRLYELAKSGPVRGFETRFYRKDGGWIWVSLNRRNMIDKDGREYFYGLCQDITERKRSEEALKSAEKLYEELAMSSLTAMYIVQKGKLRFANPYVSQYSGFSNEEMIGMDIMNFIHPEDRELVRENAVKMLRGETKTPYEYRMIDKNGRVRWLMETVSSITFGGERATLGNTMEVTEQKEMQKKLEESKSMLLQSEKISALGKLSAGVAHEILNPINILSTRIQLMEMLEELSDNVLESLKICKVQIDRVVKIARDMGHFSLRAAKLVRPGDLNRIISSTMDIAGPRLKVEDVTSHLELAGDLPLINMDIFRMEQVILNILNNAVDAMLGTSNKTLKIITRIHERGGQKTVQLVFSDSGPGIRPDHINRIFEPFFTTKDPDKGTGLGLYICFGIIQDHGGTIRAENNETGGASLIIELPYPQSGKNVVQDRQ